MKYKQRLDGVEVMNNGRRPDAQTITKIPEMAKVQKGEKSLRKSVLVHAKRANLPAHARRHAEIICGWRLYYDIP